MVSITPNYNWNVFFPTSSCSVFVQYEETLTEAFLAESFSFISECGEVLIENNKPRVGQSQMKY